MPTLRQQRGLVSVIFGCRSCDQQVLLDLDPSVVDFLTPLPLLECPWCGDSMNRTWVRDSTPAGNPLTSSHAVTRKATSPTYAAKKTE